MSSYRLLVCLAMLGWSVRELARRLACNQTTVMRWTGATSAVPDEVAAWLEALVKYYRANPPPAVIHVRSLSHNRQGRNRPDQEPDPKPGLPLDMTEGTHRAAGADGLLQG